MDTLLNYLTVAFVLALLLAPSLPGYLHERRIDRELRAAERGAGDEERPGRPEGAPGRSLDLVA
ncbi:hypothetical protein ACFWIA_31560 [Streptomyces sp. NPDC127068]|uniref:hypothetical protein n=1 Tax=Streptomyces sp. NPDC127068 TaxID=3347127 RepID=UPI003646E594